MRRKNFEILNRPLDITRVFSNFAKVAKYHQIWSHWIRRGKLLKCFALHTTRVTLQLLNWLWIFAIQSVWPDVRIKSSLYFSKVTEKLASVSFTWIDELFKLAQKVSNRYLGYILIIIYSPWFSKIAQSGHTEFHPIKNAATALFSHSWWWSMQ